jgi:hypothetical protein
MIGRDLAITLGFIAMVFGLSVALAWPRPETDQAGAVAATIEHIVGEVEDELSRMGVKESEMVEMTICFDTSGLVEVRDVTEKNSSKRIKITPNEHCLKKDTEEDLGTHGPIIDYFDKNGDEAVFIKLTNLKCGVRDLCSSGIYHSHFHYGYDLVKLSGKWTVTSDH